MTETKNQALRFLGHRGQEIGAPLDALIDESLAECRSAATPHIAYGMWDLIETTACLCLGSPHFPLPGRDIAAHLQGAKKAALLALTLGAGVDALIRRFEPVDLTRALILDACAAALAEEEADRAFTAICREAAAIGFEAGSRFSPGYGDFPIALQGSILALLNAPKKIGLTAAQNSILMPRKSITAVVGLYENGLAPPHATACSICSFQHSCPLKYGGSKAGEPI